MGIGGTGRERLGDRFDQNMYLYSCVKFSNDKMQILKYDGRNLQVHTKNGSIMVLKTFYYLDNG